MIALTLIDWLLDLFRDEDAARAFVSSPDQALRDAGLAGVTANQLATVAATAVPGLALGGNPIVGLQRAVANEYGFAPVYQPSPVFAPAPTYAPSPTFAPETDLASHNDTSLLSPTQEAGANAQQGGFNLGFGDITFGSKNTATDGAVVVNGRNNGDIVSGDGAVLGNNNSVHNGNISASHGSNIATGRDTVIRESNSTVGGSQTTTTVGGNGNTTAADARDTTTTTVTHTSTTDNSTHDDSVDTNDSIHTTTLIDSSTHLDNSHELSLASGNHLLGF